MPARNATTRAFFVAAGIAVAAVTAVTVVHPQPALAASAGTDDIYFWNATFLQAVRNTPSSPTFGPTTIARAAAIVHCGLFDVLGSAQAAFFQSGGGIGTVKYQPCLTYYNTPSTVDDNLAYGIAARDLMSYVLPGQQAYFQQRFASRYSTTQAAAGALAAAVVSGEKNNRANDGSGATTAYTPASVAGSWRPTATQHCQSAADAVTPNFGNVKPFVISSPSAYRQPLPGGYQTYSALLASPYYADQVAQVRTIGSRTSTTRSAAQTETAFFWANDTAPTYRPSGQLLQTTATITKANLTYPIDVQRIFAQVGLALADASIAAWDEKFQTPIDLWRPVSAVREPQNDGNASTVPVADWLPLSPETPCFPAWVSGHAAFGGAWESVMALNFANQSFTVQTDDPNVPGGTTRTFSTFRDAATQMANSRLYLGVHFPFDATDGLQTGGNVGVDVAQHSIVKNNCNPTCT